MTRSSRVVLLLAALVLVCGSPAAAEQPLKLGSGKVVGIISMGPVISTHGWSALMLTYRTGLPITDVESLRLEADEIWARFAFDAEKSGYSQAVISANTPETGFIIKTGKALGFAFKKVDGSWRTDEVGRPPDGKLDQAFVKTFMTRLDWENDHNNMNGLLLYLANDWALSFFDPITKSSPVKADRIRFATSEHAFLSAASNYSHKREILSVAIGNGGKTAQVVSRETTRAIVKQRVIGDVERSTDSFEWHDGTMLWKSSEAVVQSKISQ